MSRDMLAVLETWRDEQIAFLARLVNQDSGTRDRADVNKVADILAEALESLGFVVTRFPQERVGDHLLAEKPGSGPKRFLFVGHMDTVFPAGTARRRPFRVEGGRAYGPGVLDMKGGIAALIFALRAHRDAATRAFSETGITVLFNSDEELLSPTSKELIQAQARQAHSVGILEPARSGGEYVMARKGVGTFYLEVEGKAAHAGVQPELGASAIWDLAQKVCAFHALSDSATGTTVNVGVVRGGERPNVVADHAYAEVDIRVWTRDEADRLVAALSAIAERAHVPGTRAKFWGGLPFPPWPPGDPGTEQLLEFLREAGRQIGLEVKAIGTGGGSDGNHTSQVAPTVDGLGPQGNRAHSPEEYVELPTLLERTKMIALFLSLWHDRFAVR